MALAHSSPTMMTSILLRPRPFPSPGPSPSPSPSPVSTPLPGLQPDLSSSSSSSFASGSYFELHRASSARSRRIRFAPLPEPDRDLLTPHDDHAYDVPQPDTKSATQPVASPGDVHDDFPTLSPSVSPESTISSVRSTPTIRLPPDTSPKNAKKSSLNLLRPFAFFRRANSSSHLSQSASLPNSRNASLSSLTRSSTSVPNSPVFHTTNLPHVSTEDIFFLRRKSLFRGRSGSLPPRASSPPPRRSDLSKLPHRSISTSSSSAVKPVDGKRDCGGESSCQSRDAGALVGSGPKKRRASSSSTVLGAGGGRHTSSVKMLPNDIPPRPSTAPSSPFAPPKKYVKMLNGRVYGAKRYAAQTLANPFANVRDEPEFVEWGYGGMGSVHASAGIGNDMWKGLQRSERGGALLSGSSFGPDATAEATTARGGGGSGARTTSPIARRKMSDNVPECGMGNVNVNGNTDEDDGSGMGWVKKRRAEREAKARLEQEAELERKMQEKRKSSDSMDASMYASTASTSTSLTACTSTASTDVTTPTTSPLTSRSPSMSDLKLTASSSRDLDATPPCTVTGEQSRCVAAQPVPVSKDVHEHHVLTAVRLSPTISSLSRKHGSHPPSPLNMETARSTNSSDEDEEEPGQGSDEGEEQDDVDDDDERNAQDVRSKTALGAGVEKISRHVDVETR